jgi:hypothetical protein
MHKQYLVHCFDRDFSTSFYTKMGQKFLWKYDKELDLNLQNLMKQNLMKTTMEECYQRDWQSFDFIKGHVVSLFGFGTDIQNTILQEKCFRSPDTLMFWSTNEEDRFYVRLLPDQIIFVVQYHGFLVPPNKDVKAPDDLLPVL